MTQPAIRTEHVTRDFRTVRAVDDLTMEVPAGIIFGFLGPNGAGKTTTIHLLLGLLEPTGGRSEVLGFDTLTQAHAIRARTGALLEHDGIYEHLSAADNLEFYARIWHLPKSDRQARIKALLGEMGLWDRRDEQVGKWSRGMKQKLALARALIHRPPLLLLDEPSVCASRLPSSARATSWRRGIPTSCARGQAGRASRSSDVASTSACWHRFEGDPR
jgi:ABC-2 type transport system ATP-binding protein